MDYTNEFWLAPDGSDANPGTQASPLLTIAEAFRRIPVGYPGAPVLHLAAGTHAPAVSGPTSWCVPPGAGVGAQPIRLVGTRVDSGLGPLVATGGVKGSGAVFGSIATATALTPGAWAGWMVRCVSGTLANAGVSRWVTGNDAGSLAIDDAWPAAPVAGDVFVVERTGSVLPLSAPSGPAPWHVYAPTGVVFEDVELRTTGAGSYVDAALHAGEWSFVNCRLSSGGPFLAVSMLAGRTNVGVRPTGLGLGGVDEAAVCGIYAEAGVALFSTFAGGEAVIHRTVYHGSQPNFVGPGRVAAFTGVYVGALARVQVGGGCPYFAASACRVAGPGGDGFQIGACPAFSLTAVDVSAGAGSGVFAFNGARGVVTGLTGTGLAGTGFVLANNSQARVTDPNTGTTIGTDAARAVRVGANATDTWANVNAGTPASLCDFAAASAPQFCAISK